MKPPSWIVLTPPKGRLSADGKSVEFDMRIRRWHPGLWWALIKHLIPGRAMTYVRIRPEPRLSWHVVLTPTRMFDTYRGLIV